MDNESLVTCVTCDIEIDDPEHYSRNGNAICQACLDSVWQYCNECCENVRDIYHNSEVDVCNACVRDNYYCCVDCGYLIHSNYSYYSEYDDEFRCESCYDEHTQDNGGIEGVFGYHHHAPFDMRYHNSVGADLYPTASTYFGVELESEYMDDSISGTLHDLMRDYIGHAEQDGSLNEGIEFITQPATLNAWRGAFGERIKQYMETVKNIGGSFGASTCGAHVHVSKTAFRDANHIARFATFITNNREWTLRLSGREYLDQWAKAFPLYRGELRRSIKYRNGDRYRAVNLNNPHTVEVRFFKGTNDYSEIIGEIEFISALIEYTRDLTASDAVIGALLSDNFTTWLDDQESGYTLARQLITARTAA